MRLPKCVSLEYQTIFQFAYLMVKNSFVTWHFLLFRTWEQSSQENSVSYHGNNWLFFWFCLFLTLLYLASCYKNFYYIFFSATYIFLGCLIRYIQLTNPEDIAERWSSMRNQSVFLTWLLSEEERESFLDELIFQMYISTFR